MAKGSVRKKGKKWYYRFYVEDESGRLVQKEYAGTESKSETEALLRKAMEDYESKKFIAKSENVVLGDLLDMWIEEEVKPGNLSNGTVMAYQGTVSRIKADPIGKRKLKSITSDHLQSYMDLLSFGDADNKALSKGYMRLFSAVLQGAFRFAVFPKRLITFNPMQYVVRRSKKEEYELFEDENSNISSQVITHDKYLRLTDYLEKKKNPALLPIQIAYYTGLRIGEVCGLTWQDINLDEQYLTVRRSIRYNGVRHKTEIGTTKRSKIRTVDFCDTLAEILKDAKKEQQKNLLKYSELYTCNYYKIVREKDRTYYEVYTLPQSDEQPEDYKEISFVCTQTDGRFESSSAVEQTCRSMRKKLKGFENFHFHQFRHTYTSNLLSGCAAPKDVQELLGHADVSTTMNIYAHASKETKRSSARLLDKVVGSD
ncbi:MAG: site-specific integrase [Oscillospiraceae bacterium]|nr:site-specific integrase [Oscillospiraceae bacterium]